MAGDRSGQRSQGMRWPYGPCGLITPFNFPAEIPGLQLIGGILCGNKMLIKPDSRVAMVVEQMVQDLLDCGLPEEYVVLAHADRSQAGALFQELVGVLRAVQFTGSSQVAERLISTFKGKVRIEDRSEFIF